MKPFHGDEYDATNLEVGEDDENLYFKSNTSKYLRARGVAATVKIDKFTPYQHAVPGKGSGYDS